MRSRQANRGGVDVIDCCARDLLLIGSHRHRAARCRHSTFLPGHKGEMCRHALRPIFSTMLHRQHERHQEIEILTPHIQIRNATERTYESAKHRGAESLCNSSSFTRMLRPSWPSWPPAARRRKLRWRVSRVARCSLGWIPQFERKTGTCGSAVRPMGVRSPAAWNG
jgi:hypothetical protein